MWLPDMYNRLAIYSERHPDHILTVCDIIAALANSTPVSDSFMIVKGLENQTESSSFTSSDLTKLNLSDIVLTNTIANYTERITTEDVTGNVTSIVNSDATVGMTNGTWALSNAQAASTCSSTVNPAAFRNSLAIGLVCIVTYSFAGYLVKFVKRKPLMSK
jgi:hypothetical protein